MQLIIEIPDNPELQAQLVSAVNWALRDENNQPATLTGAEAKAWWEARIRRGIRSFTLRELQDQAVTQVTMGASWDT